MQRFFRKIRQVLLSSGHTHKYILYALGEIALVVLGILIALQINNWNEKQKDKATAIEIYKNLQSSLKQDSISVQRIIDIQRKSLIAQKKIILSDFEEFNADSGQSNLDTLLLDIMFGTLTFYPKDGIYNLMLANNSIDLIESGRVKDAINNLYEYQYKRYENLDPVIEHKFQYNLNPVTSKKLGFIVQFTPEFDLVTRVDPRLFEKYYDELSAECKDIYSILSYSLALLGDIRKSINELSGLIRYELESTNN